MSRDEICFLDLYSIRARPDAVWSTSQVALSFHAGDEPDTGCAPVIEQGVILETTVKSYFTVFWKGKDEKACL